MSETTTQISNYLRVAGVAKRLGASPAKVRLLIHGGKLAAERDGDRGMFLVAEDECERYLAERRSRSLAAQSA